jgi:hypothetical protein
MARRASSMIAVCAGALSFNSESKIQLPRSAKGFHFQEVVFDHMELFFVFQNLTGTGLK